MSRPAVIRTSFATSLGQIATGARVSESSFAFLICFSDSRLLGFLPLGRSPVGLILRWVSGRGSSGRGSLGRGSSDSGSLGRRSSGRGCRSL